MTIKFCKMHGLGNDFMVIDCVNQHIKVSPQQIAAWAKRDTGIGFDQCLIIEPSKSPSVDFFYRIFNADGQEVGQCGNGARCLALFARYYGLTQKNNLIVATKTTTMRLTINDDNTVSVDMGLPKLNPDLIPFIAPQQAKEYVLELDDAPFVRIHTINVGNPHAVLVVSDTDSAPVQSLGAAIRQHPRFPEQTNVGFMQILNPKHIKLRVFERGTGETQACGSGAVAAAAIGRLYHGLGEEVKVSLLGGDLTISWPDFEESLVLTGPATFVYEGQLF